LWVWKESSNRLKDPSLLLVYSLLDGKGLSTRWQGCLWQIHIAATQFILRLKSKLQEFMKTKMRKVKNVTHFSG
jgi:hypothetical protein